MASRLEAVGLAAADEDRPPVGQADEVAAPVVLAGDVDPGRPVGGEGAVEGAVHGEAVGDEVDLGLGGVLAVAGGDQPVAGQRHRVGLAHVGQDRAHGDAGVAEGGVEGAGGGQAEQHGADHAAHGGVAGDDDLAVGQLDRGLRALGDRRDRRPRPRAGGAEAGVLGAIGVQADDGEVDVGAAGGHGLVADDQQAVAGELDQAPDGVAPEGGALGHAGAQVEADDAAGCRRSGRGGRRCRSGQGRCRCPWPGRRRRPVSCSIGPAMTTFPSPWTTTPRASSTALPPLATLTVAEPGGAEGRVERAVGVEAGDGHHAGRRRRPRSRRRKGGWPESKAAPRNRSCSRGGDGDGLDRVVGEAGRRAAGLGGRRGGGRVDPHARSGERARGGSAGESSETPPKVSHA